MGYAYGGVVFLLYSWALRGFFYQLSSLILYHSVGDILAILAYMMALALLESLAVMLLLVLAAMALPPRWFANGFAYKSFLAMLIAAAGAVGLEIYLTKKVTEGWYLVMGAALGIAILWGAILFFERAARFRRLLLGLVDRMSIFLYLYVPVGILSLLVVLGRILA